MAELTGISWCDSTWNPWVGCTKVSPACDHCYAERLMDHRMHKVQWGAGKPRQRTSAANWRQPALWEREHEAFALAHEGRRRRVFCASLADVFDNEVDPQWRADLFDLIANTPHLDWLLLTKRIGNADAMMRRALQDDSPDWPWPNLWLGATIVTQEEADRDIQKLLAVPAAKRFVSIEPMLGPVRLTDIPVGGGHGHHEFDPIITGNVLTRQNRVHWVICGGESGPQARPMHPDWVRSLRDQCAAAGVPFHFKQWGEWLPSLQATQANLTGVPRLEPERVRWMYQDGSTAPIGEGEKPSNMQALRVGTKAAGRLLDGVEHNGFPS